MPPSTNKAARRRPSKKHNRRTTNRIRKSSSPRSPQSILAQARKTTLLRSPKNLFAVVGGKRVAPAENQDGRQALKYSKFVMLPVSTEPFEKNIFEREPLSENYVFVPKGDVYVTRHCRSKTKESERIVYLVYHRTGKRTLGIRVPSDIYAEVLHSAAATAETRANAVKQRDEKDLSRSRQILQKQFPLMPAETLETILDHAFLKGSGRVGRTAMKTDERKAQLAVEAHIRHTQTPYEALLDEGKERHKAREAVWGMVQAIKTAWEGKGIQPTGLLTLRSRAAELV